MTTKDKDHIFKLLNKVISFITMFYGSDNKLNDIATDLESIIERIYE